MEELTQDVIKDKAKENEFTLLYMYAPGCKVCEGFTEPMEKEISPQLEQHGIKCFKMNALENTDFAKEVQLEAVPFMAIFHAGNYIGGDSMTSKEKLDEFLQMVYIFRQRQMEQALQPEYKEVQ